MSVLYEVENRRQQPETSQRPTPTDMFADLAYIAAQACGVSASAILLNEGTEMRVVGEYGWPLRANLRIPLEPNDFSVALNAHDLPGLRLGQLWIRFLASAPLLDPVGNPLGLLYVADPNEPEPNPARHDILAALARQASALLELRRQSLTDSLTGLANREAFEERLIEEVERSRRYGTLLSLLMLDADDFKGFNDAFGHPAGDEALRFLAQLLTRSVRASDLVARYGGEEFAVIVPEVDGVGARLLAERCRRAAEEACWPHQNVTLSVGLASLACNAGDSQGLVMAADQALYRAKRQGGNCTSESTSPTQTGHPKDIQS